MSQVNYAVDTIDKYKDPKGYRSYKLNILRSYHMPMIKDLGISVNDFNMKTPFYDKGRYVIGLYASEFAKEKGFFFELVNSDHEPLDINRQVYRIARNENFHEEYEQNEKGSYLMLVDELRKVNPQSVAISKDSAVTSNDKLFAKESSQSKAPVFSSNPNPNADTEDALYSEMTIRDFIAIQTGKPVSLKNWLNRLITKANTQ